MRCRGAMLAVALAAVTALGATEWPQPPLPPKARVEAVGEDMRLNRKPTRLYRFEVAQPAHQVRDFYRSAFGQQRVEPPLEGFLVVSGRQGMDVFTTVRLRSLGPDRTEGYVMQARGAQGEGVPPVMPADSQVISETESQDSGRHSHLLLVRNGHSVQANAEFYVERLRMQGMHLVSRRSDPRGNERGQVLFFEGHRRAGVVTVDDAGSHRVVMVNLLREAP